MYGYTTVGLFISWWLSGLFPIFWHIWIMLLWTFLYKFLYGHMSLLLLGEAAGLYGNSILAFLSSVQFSRSVVSDSLQPHESQHARPPCPSQTPGVYSNSCPSSNKLFSTVAALCFILIGYVLGLLIFSCAYSSQVFILWTYWSYQLPLYGFNQWLIFSLHPAKPISNIWLSLSLFTETLHLDSRKSVSSFSST